MQSTWLPYDPSTHFPLENIPFGVYHTAEGTTRCCTRVGDSVIDLSTIFQLFDGPLFSTL